MSDLISNTHQINHLDVYFPNHPDWFSWDLPIFQKITKTSEFSENQWKHFYHKNLIFWVRNMEMGDNVFKVRKKSNLGVLWSSNSKYRPKKNPFLIFLLLREFSTDFHKFSLFFSVVHLKCDCKSGNPSGKLGSLLMSEQSDAPKLQIAHLWSTLSISRAPRMLLDVQVGGRTMISNCTLIVLENIIS